MGSDPYMQYFCGEAYFQHEFPFVPSDLVHFRHRIGEGGFSKIFSQIIRIHGEQIDEEKMMLSDTTVQGNNITFPTDTKLYKKIIDKCNKIAERHDISVRQSYKRVSKQLLWDCYNPTHPKRKKKGRKARHHLHTIAARIVRELECLFAGKLFEVYRNELELFNWVLSQHKHSKNKIYSLHKPHTDCISKGKRIGSMNSETK